MAVFKCKMCGGSLEVTEGMTVCECEYCGTQQTLPKTDNEQSLNLFNRANHFRQQCEFDKAAEIYEKMTAQSGADAELYWSLVLCRYGIEYVDDPLTHKKIATCHRTQFKSILDDPDYQTALQYADFAQRSVYEREAAYIDKVQKGILEISNKEQPFDVFICYKETVENGRRTPDSVLAQELYYGLTQEGFKVFFSRITLESKLGTEYEPYIFAALNSAKVMVVVGTKPEYFNAVWVRNEWSRYLMLMQEDRSRTLIPAYKDMDPYDLPDALSMFQAQDMSKLGFMQDLIRGIKKIAAPEQEKPVVQQTVIQQTPVNSNIENLLKRGFLALETSKWQEANGFFEQVLNENVEEPRAYIGKLCAEYEVQGEEKLSALQKDFTASENYKMACRFGGADVEKRLFAYNQQGLYDAAMRSMQAAKSSADYQAVKSRFVALGAFGDAAQKAEECAQKVAEIQEQEEYDRKLSSYLTAEKLMKNGTQHDLEEAADRFRSLSGFKDADELREKCLAKAQEIKSQEEQAQRRQQEAAAKAAAKTKKIAIIGAASAAAVAALALVTAFVIVPNVKYSSANKMLESGSYEEAEQAFLALGDFKDSAEKSLQAKDELYEQAVDLFNNLEYEKSLVIFQKLGDYKDTSSFLNSWNMKQVGDVVCFGDYEWYIIEKSGETYKLLCKDVVKTACFNNSNEYSINPCWELSNIREWLNSEFYNSFDEEDKQRIQVTVCSNTDCKGFVVYGVGDSKDLSFEGNPTEDYFFLPSVEEVKNLDMSIRSCGAGWFTRTGGDRIVQALLPDGSFNQALPDAEDGVRPAVTVNLGDSDNVVEIAQSSDNDDNANKVRVAQIVALAQEGSFYEAYKLYQENRRYLSESFSEIMTSNGFQSQMDDFTNELKKCAGTYIRTDSGTGPNSSEVLKKIVEINEDTWMISVTDGLATENGATSRYPFFFEQNEITLESSHKTLCIDTTTGELTESSTWGNEAGTSCFKKQ